jgi:small conductance mechanosensitive channel
MDRLWEQTRDEFTSAYGSLVSFVIHAVEALLILIVAVVISRALRARVRRSAIEPRLGPNLTALLANAVAIGTYVLAGTFILGLFGANWTALLAFLSVSTVAISLSFQDVLKNFIAGVYILLERPFSIGDRVRVRDFDGLVETIEIRTTSLRNEREERVLIPNAVMFAEILTNRSTYPIQYQAVVLDGVIVPPEDIEREVRDTLATVTNLDEKQPKVSWQSLGENGATVTVEFWQPAGAALTPVVLARLKERFPSATASVRES